MEKGDMNYKYLEWFGVVTAIVYSLLVAFNIGAEFVGFSLLFVSAIAIGFWAYLGRHPGHFVTANFLRTCWHYRHAALVFKCLA